MAREGGFELEYANEGLAGEAAAIELSGDVEGLSPQEALEVVLPAVGLAHRIEGGTLSVSRVARVVGQEPE